MSAIESDQQFLSALPPDSSFVSVSSRTEDERAAQTRAQQNGWARVDRSIWQFAITAEGRSYLASLAATGDAR